ncbi:MAG: hypothetical protein ACRDID_23835, partial [Ktedonobacterales bacterium]
MGARAIPKRRGAWASICIATGAAVMIAALGGSARLDLGTRRPRVGAAKEAEASAGSAAGQNARH